MENVEKKIGYTFQEAALLRLAFTHRSYWNEHMDEVEGHNERLEFLGDSVLGLLISDHLYQRDPAMPEGELSSLRSRLVDAPTCAKYVEALGIAEDLLLGKGEKNNEGRGRLSILADLFEALIGAIYLDGGLDAAKKFFFGHFSERVEALLASPQRNWKAELQDFAQKVLKEAPLYKVLEEQGPDHDKHFRIAVFVGGEKVGEGEGSSKKHAQQAAAERALLKMERER